MLSKIELNRSFTVSIYFAGRAAYNAAPTRENAIYSPAFVKWVGATNYLENLLSEPGVWATGAMLRMLIPPLDLT